MPHELKERLDKKEDVFLLDVREPEEFEIAKISENLIPLSQLESRANELDRAKYTVVFCHHGIRSAQAVQYLMGLGFNKIQVFFSSDQFQDS